MTRPAFGAPRFLLSPAAPAATLPGSSAAAAPAGGATGDGVNGAAAAPATPPSPPAAPSPPGGAQPPADGPQAYRPEGLPDHLYGATDKETLDRLAGAYKGARGKIGEGDTVPDKPEAYAFEASDKLKPYVENFDKDPVYNAVRGIAHKAGITDKQFKAFMPGVLEHFVDGELVAAPIDPKALLRSMAPADLASASDAEKETAGARRVQDNIAWIDGAKANKVMPEGVADFFAASAAGDTRAHAAIEWMRGSASEPKPAMGGGSGGSVSEGDLKARIADPRNQVGGAQFDRAFALETDELYRKQYG